MKACRHLSSATVFQMLVCVVGRMPNKLLRKRESRVGGRGSDPYVGSSWRASWFYSSSSLGYSLLLKGKLLGRGTRYA